MLTQSEADALIVMRKVFQHAITISLPPGADQTHELVGDDNRERFGLDLWRSTFRLTKVKHQTRGRNVIVLVRLDVDGSPHTNPDAAVLRGTHIHLYREGYEAKWAYPVDPAEFTDVSDIQQTFVEFCRYCNIVNVPPFQGGLV